MINDGNAWRGPTGDRIGKPIRRETVRPNERPLTEPKPLKAPAKPQREAVPVK